MAFARNSVFQQTVTPFTQAIRFLISGAVSTLIHWSVMSVLIYWNLNPLCSTSIGAVTGAAVNYFLQYSFTFVSETPHGKALQRYLVAIGISWLLNFLLFFLLSISAGLAVIPAQLLTTFLVMLINYTGYRNFVFK